MSYLVHCYIEVEDEKDHDELRGLFAQHEYPVAYAPDQSDLPDTIEDLEAQWRQGEELLSEEDED